MKRIVTAAVAFAVLALFALALPQAIRAADTATKNDSSEKDDTTAKTDTVAKDDTAAKDGTSAKNNTSAKAATPAPRPADRVVVIYFHRTQRCPTCLRMGSYSEEAVVKGFAKQIKDGTVEFHYVDFQDEKNASLTKGYKVGGPTLIVVKVVKNKAVEVENLKEIWTKNRDKDAFLKYVQENVATFQKPESKTAMKPEADRSAQKAK
jgi:hypothetical protein